MGMSRAAFGVAAGALADVGLRARRRAARRLLPFVFLLNILN